MTESRTSARYSPGGSPWDTAASTMTTSASRATAASGKIAKNDIEMNQHDNMYILDLAALLGVMTGMQRTILRRNLIRSL